MKKLITLLLAAMFALSLATLSNAEGNVFGGLVLTNDETTFTVENAYGSRMIFTPGEAIEQMPEVGSVVTVEFSGDITAQLIAETVTVDTPADIKTVAGVIKSVSRDMIELETENNVVLALTVGDTTKITGNASALAVGQTVNVTYAESVLLVNVIDIATEIEIIAEPESETVIVETEEKEEKTEKKEKKNRKAEGTVTKLTDSKVTIKTSKGKKWSFRLKNADISGYDLEKGCKVTITYDGNPKDTPAAKKIKVTKPASHEPTTHSKTGFCESLTNSWITLDNGFEANIEGAKHSGKGYRGEGTKVKVTYYYDDQLGANVAKKLKWYEEDNLPEVEEETRVDSDGSGMDIWTPSYDEDQAE